MKKKLLTSILTICVFLSLNLILPIKQAEAIAPVVLTGELVKVVGTALVASGFVYASNEELQAETYKYYTSATDTIKLYWDNIAINGVTSFVVADYILDSIGTYKTQSIHYTGFQGDILYQDSIALVNPNIDTTGFLPISTSSMESLWQNTDINIHPLGTMSVSYMPTTNGQIINEIFVKGTNTLALSFWLTYYDFNNGGTQFSIWDYVNNQPLVPQYDISNILTAGIPVKLDYIINGKTAHILANGLLLHTVTHTHELVFGNLKGIRGHYGDLVAPTINAPTRSISLNIPVGQTHLNNSDTRLKPDSVLAIPTTLTGINSTDLTITDSTSTTPPADGSITWDWSVPWTSLMDWLDKIFKELGKIITSIGNISRDILDGLWDIIERLFVPDSFIITGLVSKILTDVQNAFPWIKQIQDLFLPFGSLAESNRPQWFLFGVPVLNYTWLDLNIGQIRMWTGGVLYLFTALGLLRHFRPKPVIS